MQFGSLVPLKSTVVYRSNLSWKQRVVCFCWLVETTLEPDIVPTLLLFSATDSQLIVLSALCQKRVLWCAVLLVHWTITG